MSIPSEERADTNTTPEELKKRYRAQGYSILAYTDHEILVDHSDLNDEDFLALTGIEYAFMEQPDYCLSKTIELNIIGQNLEIEIENVINEEIEGILYDLEINTILKYKIDDIIFSDLTIKKKRIELRKLKKDKLEPKYINMFIGLLDFIEKK